MVTELPYGVGTEKVIERIKDLVQGKKLQGIADIKDLTDREKGLRLVIEVKNGFHPEALLEQLYRQTPMEDTFGINTVALVDGQPRTLGLKELLEVFLEHRFDVVRRRSPYRRGKAADRLHLVDGLLVAILDIDEVIQLIRSSDNAARPRERLIAGLRPHRDPGQLHPRHAAAPAHQVLAGSSWRRSSRAASATIEELDAILADEALLRKVVSDELAEVAKTYGTPRRTVLLESAGHAPVTATAVPLEVADDPCFVFLSSTGLLARTTHAPSRPAPAAAGPTTTSSSRRCATTARGEVGVLTSRGRLLKLGVLDLPALPASANDPNLQGGAPVSEFALAGARRAGAGALRAAPPTARAWRSAPAQGVVKRVNPEVLGQRRAGRSSRSRTATRSSARSSWPPASETLCFITTDAQLLHFGADGVRPQGRSGGGMAGVRLAAGEPRRVVRRRRPGRRGRGHRRPGPSTALPGTEPGAVKVTPFSEYPPKGRATGGVRCHRFLKGEDAPASSPGPARPRPGPRRPAARPSTCPRPTGRRDGSGMPGQPADRGVRRAGRRRGSRRPTGVAG